MSAKANHFKIGLFVLVAILGLLGILLMLGAGQLGKPRFYMETYIDGSVQGLTVGSPLKLRGVPIGTVSGIEFSDVRYKGDGGAGRGYVVVIMEVDSESLGTVGGLTPKEDIALKVEQGYRVRITTVGVTGNSIMEIDVFDPLRYPPLPYEWDPLLPYMPSAPPLLSSMVDSFQEILRNLEETDLKRTNEDLQALLQEITGGVRDLREIEINPLVQQANTSMLNLDAGIADLRLLVGDLNKKVNEVDAAGISDEATALLENLGLSNTRLQETLAQYQTLATTSLNPDDIATTLQNLRISSENLRSVTEDLQTNPSGVLLGEPPPPADRGGLLRRRR